MMRRPKHRHHPSIWWRERRRAEEAGRKRWFARPLRSVPEAEMLACWRSIWNSALPLDDYYRVPAGVLAASATPHSGITASAKDWGA